MKILWAKSDFLHPTTRGGQIRTLEMLRRLHERNEIHYVGFENPASPEGVGRSSEYCTRAYPIRHVPPARRSLKFLGQLAAGLRSKLPVSIRRYESAEMRGVLSGLLRNNDFDAVVCDFLTPAVNFPDLSKAVLFQHNVESVIWDRSAEQASNVLAKKYLRLQAERMAAFERQVCHAVKHVIAVSKQDADVMMERFALRRVTAIPTGVDVAFFTPKGEPEPATDLVFVGSMDWLPNIDAMRFFVNDVLPLIRRSRPECTLSIVGRTPGPEVLAFAQRDPRIKVTGTVADVRPFLWDARLSIVPLRIGGGTRLKIYESMAARTPVLSTTVGAEGLSVTAPAQIYLADTAADFAQKCVMLLENAHERKRLASDAWDLVSRRYSWETVARSFESVIELAARRN